MRRRWTADEITRLLKEADRDLAKGLTVSDICRKHGIGQSMYYRWRQKRDPDKVDTDRRCRELELEVDRLKKLVAELLLDKTMLQDVAKKKVVSPDQQRAAADYLGERYGIATADLSCLGAISFGASIPPEAPCRKRPKFPLPRVRHEAGTPWKCQPHSRCSGRSAR
jgi:putative transposase